jgi:hypothetical protein
MRKLFVIVAVLSSGLAFAGEYTVEKVNDSGTRAVVKTTGDKLLYVGDTLEMRDEFAEVCSGSVVKVEPKSVVLDISDCKNAKAVKPGVELTKGAPSVAKTADVKTAKATGLNTPNEDWYFNLGVGFGSVNYDDNALNDAFKDADNQPGVNRSKVSVQLEFYWPLADRKSMHGISGFGFNDILSTTGGEEISISQNLYAYSYQQYFGTNIGDGWFYRVGGGLARYSVYVDTTSYYISDSSEWGLGAIGGGGYSWPVGTDTRFALSGLISLVNADDSRATTSQLNLSWLF